MVSQYQIVSLHLDFLLISLENYNISQQPYNVEYVISTQSFPVWSSNKSKQLQLMSLFINSISSRYTVLV
jgi:hypothetical protein